MRTFLVVLVVVASVARGAAQTPSEAPPATPTAAQVPTFRTGVDVITVDVAALDRAGRPVHDLAAADFTVRIDGRPRRVVSLREVAFDAAAIRRDLTAQPFESSFSTNQSAPTARMVVLAVDQLNIQPGSARQLLQSASRFLDSLTPLDRVAFFAYPAPGISVDFTVDRTRVRRAMDLVVGAAQRWESKFNIGLFEAVRAILKNDEVMQDRVVARECRRLDGLSLDECTRQVVTDMALMVNRVREDRKRSVTGLEGLLDSLSLVDTPKTVILLSEGLILEDPSDVDGVVRAASRARASLNVLMMDVLRGSDVGRGAVMPPTMSEDRELQTSGLRELAAASRGTLFNVFGNGSTIFDRLASEMSAYYLLGVEQEAGDRDDRSHRIDVEVRRQGIELRSHRAFVLSPPRGRASDNERLLDLLRAPFGVAEVPLRATTFAVQDEASEKVRMLIAADVDQAGSEPGDYWVGWALVDAEGRIAAGANGRRRLTPADDTSALQFRTEALVEPGTYSLRLGVLDGTGRRGALVREVQAWKLAGEPFAVADLVVGPPPPSGQVVVASVEPRIRGNVAAVVELYAATPASFAMTRVAFEVARDQDGPALLTVEADMVDTEKPTTRAAQALVTPTALPEGRYVMRARILRDGTAAGLLVRPFLLTAPGPAATTTVATAPRVYRPSSVPGFDRSVVLQPDVIASLLDEVAQRSPGLGRAVTEARSGRYATGALEALSEGDQEAAAFLKGLDLYVKGQLEQAATQLNVAAGPRRAFFPAALLLGATLAATGRDRDAASAWQLAFGSAVRPRLAYEWFADARLRDGQPQSVVDVLGPIWQRVPANEPLAERLGTALVMLGRFDAALPLLEDVLERTPGSQDGLVAAIAARVESAAEAGRPLTPAERTRLLEWASRLDDAHKPAAERYLSTIR